MQLSGVLFSDAARNLKQIGHAKATWALVFTMVMVQIAVACLGGVDVLGAFFETMGLSRAGVISGNVWQVLSYGFLHGGWMHAGLNVFFLMMIGSRIEHMIGSKALAGSTFFCIAGGGVSHLLLGTGLLVGMSGGCVGLLLLLVTLSPQSRMFPLPLSGKSLGLGILIAELSLALMDPALGVPFLAAAGRFFEKQGWAEWFKIGHACHFGGGVAGVVFGIWILRPTITLDRLRRERTRREATLDRNAK